jgi:hypothetical protein
MGLYLARQPNGRLALFSTVVDNFVAVQMTATEAYAELRGRGWDERAATDAVSRGGRDDPIGPTDRRLCDPPLSRWYESLLSIMIVHGTAGLVTFLSECPETFAADIDLTPTEDTHADEG